MQKLRIVISLCALLIAPSIWGQTVPSKIQITLDLQNRYLVDLLKVLEVPGYTRPESADHEGLIYYEDAERDMIYGLPRDQWVVNEAHMLDYVVLDNNIPPRELARGRFSDTDIRFACQPDGTDLDAMKPMLGETIIAPRNTYLLEIPFDLRTARWLDVTRNHSTYRLDLHYGGGVAAAAVTPTPTRIGSPRLIISNGPSTSKIDLLIMSDGYDTGNIYEFQNLVARVAPAIISGGWQGNHSSMFNIWRIDVNGTFGPATSGPMWPTDLATLYSIAGAAPFDQIMLVVKNSYPSGRPMSNDTDLFTSTDGTPDVFHVVADVARHELGHSLGQMADEYGPFGSPQLIWFPAGPIRASGNDVRWDNLTVWGRVGDFNTLQQKRPLWARLMGPGTIMDRTMVQDQLHHWFWDTSTWEGGALADFDIWRSNPTGAMCCSGSPWNSVPYDVMTKHTARFIPQGQQLLGSVQLLQPAPGVTVAGNRMTFRWLSVPGATDYHLIVRKLFTGETYLTIPTNQLEMEIYTASLRRGEIYQWTVIAANNRSSGGETPSSTWSTFGFVPTTPYATQCGDLDHNGVLSLNDGLLLVDILYNGAWADEETCRIADVNSDAILTHTKDFPNDFGDLEIINYWSQCNPAQNPQGCGTAPGHLAGQYPATPICTTAPGTPIANCSRVFKCGDFNNDGRVTILDALAISQLAAGLISISPADPQAFRKCGSADANGDRSLGILDSLLVAQFAAGVISDLRCGALVPGPGGSLPGWCQ